MAFPLPRSAQPVECWIPPEDTYGVGVKGSREAGPMRVPVNTGPRLGGDNSVSQVKGPENDLIVYSQIKYFKKPRQAKFSAREDKQNDVIVT